MLRTRRYDRGSVPEVTGTHADLYHRLRNPIFNRMRFRIIAVLQNELPNDRPIKKKPSDSAVDIDNEDGDDAGATAATFVEPKTKPKRKRASTPAGPVPFDGVTAPAASMRSVAIKAEDYERVSSPLSTNETYEQDRDNRPFTMDILHELMATYDGWSQNDLTEEEKEVDRRKAAIVVSRLKREDDAPVEVLDDLIRQYRSMDSGELANEEELLEIRKIALTISRGKFASSK
ncbi:HMG box protein [Colletotrichum sp. SAR11_240]|nr:HMG box protein [Colletotrichum sp. SAR11_240]